MQVCSAFAIVEHSAKCSDLSQLPEALQLSVVQWVPLS